MHDTGIYHAMNQAIDLSIGKYVWFINAGDVILGNDGISKVHLEIKKENYIVLFYCSCTFSGKNYTRESPKKFSKLYLFRTALNHQCQIWSRKAFSQKKFDNEYSVLADYEFLLRHVLSNNLTAKKIRNLKVGYAGNGYSEKEEMQERISNEREKIRKRYFNYYEHFIYSILNDSVLLLKYFAENLPMIRFINKKINPFKRYH